MTVTEALELVRQREASWDAAKADLKSLQDSIVNTENEAKEWYRQIQVNATQGNSAGMVANGNNYQASLDKIKDLQSQVAKAESVVESYRQQVVRARIALEKMQKQEYEANLAATDPTAYAAYQLANGQKSTKYLIWGALAITVVVIGIAVLRKTFQ